MRRDAVIRDPKTAEPIPEVKIPGLIPNGEGRCTYCLAHRDKLPPGETFHWAKDCPRRDQWATRGAAASRTQPHDADERKVVSVDGVEFALCWCPPGSFTMGSGNGDSDERPTIRVIVPNGFWMGETEVTQELWRKVMGDGIKPYNDKGGSYPMENISWNDCVQFVKKLNERADVKSRGLRFAIPTEAQWEYACRAGGKGDYGRTKDDAEGRLDDMGWYWSNSGRATHSATEPRTPNAWGLYDMHGNVWEWCANVYRNQPDGSLDNDTAIWASGGIRVLRGGSAWIYARDCRSAFRSGNYPDYHDGGSGLRLLAFQDGN